jgi:hypothetical protein
MDTKKKRKNALLISFSLFIIGILLSNTYRPYIYNNNIFDYHLADTIGSWICIPSASLFFCAVSKKYNFIQYIGISFIAFFIYEFAGFGTFDYYDIIALFLSTGITYLIYFVYKKNHK